VDPISLLFAANACVKGITELCSLYREAKTSFLEVKSTIDEVIGDAKAARSWWQKLFAPKPAATTSKPVAKKKEKFVAYDETQAMADIIKQLSRFWSLQDQLSEYLRAEEEKAKVYDPSISNAQMMESAMNRVMCRQQMEELSTTIREIMVYQTPGLADLYSQTYEMRQVIQEEQEKARLKEEAQKREASWQRRQEERNLQLKLGAVVATSIFLLYLWSWLLFVSQWGKK
jgi:RNA polymerase-interacting CarD/CdnL/TRCF family regulator